MPASQGGVSLCTFVCSALHALQDTQPSASVSLSHTFLGPSLDQHRFVGVHPKSGDSGSKLRYIFKAFDMDCQVFLQKECANL